MEGPLLYQGWNKWIKNGTGGCSPKLDRGKSEITMVLRAANCLPRNLEEFFAHSPQRVPVTLHT